MTAAVKNVEGLRKRSALQHRDGAARQVAAAKSSLDRLSDDLNRARQEAPGSRRLGALYRQVSALQLRIEHPEASLAELARMAGLTKPAYWKLLVRGINKGRPPGSAAFGVGR